MSHLFVMAVRVSAKRSILKLFGMHMRRKLFCGCFFVPFFRRVFKL